MTSYIARTAIKISEKRQRKEFEPTALQELVDSIQAHGLLQAIVLRQVGQDFYLVAGERRLRAITDIYDLGGTFTYGTEPVPPGMVPYVNVGDLSALAAWEAELEENIRRVDLTWQERALATTELLELRKAQAEDKDGPPPTLYDIAREVRDKPGVPNAELGEAYTATRNEVIVAKFLDDKEVAAAPSLKEAFKILKKREEREKHAELAQTLGKTFTSAQHRLVNANCLEWMGACTAPLYSVLLTDPPYGMGADKFGDSGQSAAGAHFYEDSPELWARLMDEFCPQTFRLAAPDAHAYVFCDVGKFGELRARMTAAGWRVFRTPLIWHNPAGYRAPWPDKGPQRQYEAILFATKGERNVTQMKGDVLVYSKDPNVGHPAQKPVDLLVDLLRRSTRPGDTVFDPFMGSGSTILAAHELKLPAIGIEQDQATYGLASGRVASLDSTKDMFDDQAPF